MDSDDYFVEGQTSSSILSSTFLETYGWYLLIGGGILMYIYNTKLRSHIQSYKQRKEEEEYAAKYHKNPDLLHARLVAQQQATEKLQEKYRRDAEEYQKKQEEREAKKREEILSKYGETSGARLGTKDEDKTKKSLKPEYNPLMGSGSGSSYRAPKRSKCGGGGCGQ